MYNNIQYIQNKKYFAYKGIGKYGNQGTKWPTEADLKMSQVLTLADHELTIINTF